MKQLNDLLAAANKNFDLTSSQNRESLYELVKLIYPHQDELNGQFSSLVQSTDTPLEAKIALHLLRSKVLIESIDRPLKIGVVYAMWGEQNRIHPKSEDNPNGEDSLRTKIDQLNWITNGTPIEWNLYVVDDGCPHGSGRMAEEILDQHPDKDRVKVLFLDDAVPTNDGPLRNLASANDSRKGGAIIFGAQEAIKDGCEVIIYTDADNSVHFGQIGILLEQYIKNNFKVVLGNRKDPQAVLVKQENRWGIGIKLLRHMQRMVGHSIFSLGILDSQAAFKLYEANLLKKILEDPAVYDFSFDSDWIAASIVDGQHFAKVPFAFIDSFAESASIVQGPMTTWETLLLGLVRVVEHRNLPHNKEMATVLKEEIKSSKDLDLLINVLPKELETTSDTDLGNPEIMSPKQVQDWIKKIKLNAKKHD
jgi:glycosyltransferase involved in cell wall biosynthesis